MLWGDLGYGLFTARQSLYPNSVVSSINLTNIQNIHTYIRTSTFFFRVNEEKEPSSWLTQLLYTCFCLGFFALMFWLLLPSTLVISDCLAISLSYLSLYICPLLFCRRVKSRTSKWSSAESSFTCTPWLFFLLAAISVVSPVYAIHSAPSFYSPAGNLLHRHAEYQPLDFDSFIARSLLRPYQSAFVFGPQLYWAVPLFSLCPVRLAILFTNPCMLDYPPVAYPSLVHVPSFRGTLSNSQPIGLSSFSMPGLCV